MYLTFFITVLYEIHVYELERFYRQHAIKQLPNHLRNVCNDTPNMVLNEYRFHVLITFDW